MLSCIMRKDSTPARARTLTEIFLDEINARKLSRRNQDTLDDFWSLSRFIALPVRRQLTRPEFLSLSDLGTAGLLCSFAFEARNPLRERGLIQQHLLSDNR